MGRRSVVSCFHPSLVLVSIWLCKLYSSLTYLLCIACHSSRPPQTINGVPICSKKSSNNSKEDKHVMHFFKYTSFLVHFLSLLLVHCLFCFSCLCSCYCLLYKHSSSIKQVTSRTLEPALKHLGDNYPAVVKPMHAFISTEVNFILYDTLNSF